MSIAFNCFGQCDGTVTLRAAIRPEGPWSPPSQGDLRPAGAVTGTYYVLVHPEIADGKDFMVIFINPRTNPKCQQGAAASPPGLDVCLAKLTLQ